MNAPANDIKTVFGHALEIEDAAARSAYLDRVCGADAELRAEVESLIRAHQRAGDFLKKPAAQHLATLINESDTDGDSALIGHYKLLEKIGEGGMGVVYMADQQEPVRRRVALKIIKPGMDTRQVIARFEAERQALALMDHPNIAKVLDAGATSAGHPYFVMELVRGIPITEYCDQNNLSVPQRLALLVPVCQAVQHAHQKGIIHRDIKPSNVLVTLHDGRPVPKVIDFGVAKATSQQLTEKTLFTNFAQMVGTPLYMSPEQAEMSGLDVDTRSDIYSLGVLLYELLTGSTPFESKRLNKAAIDEIRRIIREEQPPKPSTRLSTLGESRTAVAAHRQIDPGRLNQLVRGDLDWIAMKALEKDRTRRYETAIGFARDIQRFLSNEPVEACPPSTIYRFRKFASRNRRMITAAAVIVASLLLGVVASVTQAVRATRAERLAQTHLQAEAEARTEAERAHRAEIEQRKVAESRRSEADEMRQQADVSARKARQTVDEYFTLVSESTSLDLPGLQPLRKRLLESALKYYEGSCNDPSSDKSVRVELAATRLRVAQVYEQNNRIDDSIREWARALDLIEELARAKPLPTGFPLCLAGLRRSGRIVTFFTLWPTNPKDAARVRQRAITLWERFSRENPGVDEFKADLACFYCDLGDVQSYLTDFLGAMRSSQAAQGILEKLIVQHPTNPEYRTRLADALEYVSRALRTFDRWHDAERTLRQAMAIREKLEAEFPESPEYRASFAQSYIRLGSLLENTGRPNDALAAFEQSVDRWRKLVAEFPTVPGFRKRLTQSMCGFAMTLKNLGKSADAEKTLREAIALRLKLAADDPGEQGDNLAEVIEGRLKLADVLRTTGRHPEAKEQMRLAAEVQRTLIARFPENADDALGHAYRILGFGAQNRGQNEDAEQHLRQALDVFQRLATIAPKQVSHRHYLADTHRRLAEVLSAEHRMTEAEKQNRLAIDVHEKSAAELHVRPPNVFEWVASYIDLARLLAETGRAPEAEQTYERVLSAGKNLLKEPDASPPTVDALTGVHQKFAEFLHRTKRGNEALQHERQAAELLLDAGKRGAANPFFVNDLAWKLATRREIDLRLPPVAVELAKLAVRLVPADGNAWNTLGVAQFRVGDAASAESSLRKAMELRGGSNINDCFFLAMCDWQRGKKDRAGKWYNAGSLLMAKNVAKNEELLRFQSEAAALLGMKNSKGPDRIDDAAIAKAFVDADPNIKSFWCWYTLAEDNMRAGRWIEAMPDALRAANLRPEDEYLQYVLAPILARANDREAYLRQCRKLLSRYAQTTQLEWAERTAKACLVLPATEDILAAASRLAERSVKDKTHWALPYAHVAAALAAYRRGEFRVSLDWCDTALVKDGDDGWFRCGQAYYIRAMALANLGKREEARAPFEKAHAILQKMQSAASASNGRVEWHDLAICELLDQEAGQTLKTPPKQAHKP